MTLNIGVLGYRFMGKAHANALARLPMFFPDAPAVERHTLIGRDEAALADAAERFGFAHTADLGAHTIDLAGFLVGDEVGGIDRVSGHLRTFVDAYTAQVAYDSGAMGGFEATRFATGHKNDHTIEIHGSKGGLTFAVERLNELELLSESAPTAAERVSS